MESKNNPCDERRKQTLITEQSSGSEGGFSFRCFKMTHEVSELQSVSLSDQKLFCRRRRQIVQTAERSSKHRTELRLNDSINSSRHTERAAVVSTNRALAVFKRQGQQEPTNTMCVSWDREADLQRRRASSRPLPPSPRDRAARPVNTHTKGREVTH